VVYVIASDGVLHVLGNPSGKDIQKPAPFLPPNANWSDAIAVNTTLYTGTSNRCGDAPNAIWAIDLADENKPVTSWKTNGGGIVGAVAVGIDGSLIAAIGPGPTSAGGYTNAIVSVDPKTMQLKDWFTDPRAEFVTTPVIFSHGDRNIVAAATKDGRILLLDASSLGGTNHSTPLYASESLAGHRSVCPRRTGDLAGDTARSEPAGPSGSSCATYSAGRGRCTGTGPGSARRNGGYSGTRWLLVPTSSGVTALKVVDKGGQPSLQPGLGVSRNHLAVTAAHRQRCSLCSVERPRRFGGRCDRGRNCKSVRLPRCSTH
jgi:hypothetical protein